MKDIPKHTPAGVRRAFTLAELLIVIGIIALLIALILPAITRVRRQAEATNCAANLHQIGIAIATYIVGSPRHQFPYSPGTQVDPNIMWPNVLFGTPKPQVVRCPTADEDEWLSYEINYWWAIAAANAYTDFRPLKTSEIVIAGENFRGTNAPFGGFPLPDGKHTWDDARHRTYGSNYLYLDMHVTREPPRGIYGAPDPWMLPPAVEVAAYR